MAKKNEKETNQTAEVLEGENQGKSGEAGLDEAAKEKFQQKLRELLVFAKKKKNMLEYQEINDFFGEMHLDAEQIEKVLEFLEVSGVDVLRITDDADDDILLEMDDDDEVEVEKIDLSVPDGVSIEDTFRMYLK